jgi:hypothetical protein
MLNKKVEKIAILKAALAKISQEKQEIKLTREDIEGNTDKFIDYIGLDMKSEKVKGDLADVII